MFRPHSPYGKGLALGESGQPHRQSVASPDQDHHHPDGEYRQPGKAVSLRLHPLFRWGNHWLYLLLADPD